MMLEADAMAELMAGGEIPIEVDLTFLELTVAGRNPAVRVIGVVPVGTNIDNHPSGQTDICGTATLKTRVNAENKI
jgi:hypothetical protein